MVFGKAKQLYELKKKADEIKKVLEKEMVEIEEKGVRVKIRADQRVMLVEVDGEEDERLKKAVNRAIKEAQKVAAKKMRGRMDEFGIPGL